MKKRICHHINGLPLPRARRRIYGVVVVGSRIMLPTITPPCIRHHDKADDQSGYQRFDYGSQDSGSHIPNTDNPSGYISR